MEAIIHIGMPKAGSSSIQVFLKRNAAALAAQGFRHAPLNPAYGSQYELAATGVIGAGGKLQDAVARRLLGTPEKAAQRAYVEGYRTWLDTARAHWREPRFIASSEHILPWLGNNAARIAVMDDFLRARFTSVRYLLYLRPQPDFLVSSYSERIRRGEVTDFATHLAEGWPMLDYDARVRLWEGVVGAGRLDVRLMVPDALAGGELIADFCSATGIDPAGLAMPGRINPALSVEAIAMRRRLNRVLAVRRPDGKRSRSYRVALRVLGWFLPRPGTRPGLDPAQRAAIENRFAATNEALRARRFPDRAALFSPATG